MSICPNPMEDSKIRRTRKWLIFFGVLEVLIGVFAVLQLQFWLVMLFNTPGGKDVIVTSVAMFGAGAIFFAWMGIGSILTRRWVRAIMIVVSAYWFILGSLGSLMIFIVTLGTSVTGESAWFEDLSLFAISVFLPLVILPAIFFLFYRSQNIKATCEQRDPVVRWTDKIPLPVLAVLLPLACTSIAYLLSLFDSKHIFPFLNMIIKGYPAMIVIIAKVGIYAYLTVAIYKMNKSAWITTMIVTVLDFGIQSISYFLVNESDYLSSMGYNAAQIQQMQSVVDLWSNSRSGLLWAVSLILWIGYLLYVRKYFKSGIETA